MTIQTSGYFQNPYFEQMSNARSESNSIKFENLISSKKEEKSCPYSALAKDGQIEYNGVVFQCDYKTNSITLGDVTSNPRKVLNVPLSGGGHLKVNVDNLEELSHAMGMFSPEDQGAILRAIAEYNFCTSKLEELEEDENSIGEAEPETQTEEIDNVTESPLSFINAYKAVLFEKIKNNEEPSYQIGAQSFTMDEWDSFLNKIDKAEENAKEEIAEEVKERQEEQITNAQMERLLAE